MHPQNHNQKNGFTLVELLVVVAIIASLAALSAPAVTKALKRAALTTSVSNARQIKLALDIAAVDFDGDYVNDTNGEKMLSGFTASNDAFNYFNTLIASGALSASDESLFYTKELKNANSTHSKGNSDGLLTANETAYSYIKGLSNTSLGESPIITTQVSTASGATTNFHSNVWDNKVVIARVNGVVKAETLQPTSGTTSTVEETGIRGASTAKNIFEWIFDPQIVPTTTDPIAVCK